MFSPFEALSSKHAKERNYQTGVWDMDIYGRWRDERPWLLRDCPDLGLVTMNERLASVWWYWQLEWKDRYAGTSAMANIWKGWMTMDGHWTNFPRSREGGWWRECPNFGMTLEMVSLSEIVKGDRVMVMTMNWGWCMNGMDKGHTSQDLGGERWRWYPRYTLLVLLIKALTTKSFSWSPLNLVWHQSNLDESWVLSFSF